MNYNQFNQYLLILTARASAANNYTPPSTDFSNMIPAAIDYAEDRCYRDLVLLATRAQDSSLTCSGNTRSLNLSNMSTIIIIPEGVSIITPVGAIPALGTRVPFMNASLDVIDLGWPVEGLTVDPTTVPPMDRRWAMRDNQTIVLSPTPNLTYPVEITGLFRPLQISATNQTTYLSVTYPELLLSAAMIFMTGYLRNYGAQSDQPKMGMSWETQYTTLKDSAVLEEQRRRGQGVGWSQSAPTPLAKPDRTG
jgi:hypothetical protein